MRKALLRIELWLEARRLPFVAATEDLSVCHAYADVGPVPRWQGVDVETIARWVRRSCKHPVLMRKRRCFRLGLLGFRFLRMAGHDPVLRYALDNDGLSPDGPARTHCWVCIDDTEVVGAKGPGMIDLMSYPARTP
jgi:hypothetical protein